MEVLEFSFYALNRGLLFKWIWRFLSRDNSLWPRSYALTAPTQVLFLPHIHRLGLSNGGSSVLGPYGVGFVFRVKECSLGHREISDHWLFCCDLAKEIARSFVMVGLGFGTLDDSYDLGYLGLIWFSFNQVQNKCWKECFTLPGGVSGHIETISSSLIQIFEKMVFLKT
ncbi:hypothetical protein Tco_0096914 [Tanacetum coccineum]